MINPTLYVQVGDDVRLAEAAVLAAWTQFQEASGAEAVDRAIEAVDVALLGWQGRRLEAEQQKAFVLGDSRVWGVARTWNTSKAQVR